METINRRMNRQLYMKANDLDTGRVVALKEVMEKVRNNSEFVIIDSTTKKDVTQEILLQIAFDCLKAAPLDSDLLKHIIKHYGTLGAFLTSQNVA